MIRNRKDRTRFMTTAATTLRLGTRGSLLARAQSGLIARELERRHSGLTVELIPFKTSGDRIAERPLHEFGGKGLFTNELEQALLAGQIDFAVHSFKDVPVTMPLVDASELEIVAVPPREDARDALVSSRWQRLADLPNGARVGTGSLRRRVQLLSLRPDLRVQPIRGNIDTRLRKLTAGEYDAVILATAGLHRAQLFDPATMHPIAAAELLPAAGQGALALQCRRSDTRTRALLTVLNDPNTATCVAAEREIVRLLNGDCHSPIAAYGVWIDGKVQLNAAVGARDGEPPIITAEAIAAPDRAVQQVFMQLRKQGALERLHGDDSNRK